MIKESKIYYFIDRKDYVKNVNGDNVINIIGTKGSGKTTNTLKYIDNDEFIVVNCDKLLDMPIDDIFEDKFLSDIIKLLNDKYGNIPEGNEFLKCYNDIVDITKNIVLENEEFVGVIPAATMRQNMMSSYLTDKDISRDYGHMGLGFGRYALGLLWYSYLTEETLEDIRFIPIRNDVAPELLERFEFDEVTEEKMIVAKEAISNALANPYEITKSKHNSVADKAIVMDELNIDEHIAAVGGEHAE